MSALLLLVVLIFTCLYKVIRDLKAVNYVRGWILPFPPFSLYGIVAPVGRWNPGLNWFWDRRKIAYNYQQADLMSQISFIYGNPVLCTGSIEVARQILPHDSKGSMIKPPDMHLAFTIWGDNLLSANHDSWKRHRRVVSPILGAGTMSLVHEESINVYNEMIIAEQWDSQDTLHLIDISDYLKRFTLSIFCRCGFKLPIPWIASDDDNLSFGESLHTVVDTLMLKVYLPRWAYFLPIARLRKMDTAWAVFRKTTEELVQNRKEQLACDAATSNSASLKKGDILTSLVSASTEDAKVGFSEAEVIGSVFALLIAGHETTANALIATMAYLALYPVEQQKAYDEIKSVVSNPSRPKQAEITQLKILLACFYEAIRLVHPGPVLIRDISQDLPIMLSRPTERPYIIKSGTRIIIDMAGIHRNPHTYPEPERFKPSRWIGVPEQDVSMFSLGPRVCVGRRFAQTEAMCFLSLLLRDWKLETILRQGETRSEWEERVLKGRLRGLSFGVGAVPLKLQRRFS